MMSMMKMMMMLLPTAAATLHILILIHIHILILLTIARYLCIYSYLYYYFALFFAACACHNRREQSVAQRSLVSGLRLSFSATFDAFTCVLHFLLLPPNSYYLLGYCCLSVLFIVKAALTLLRIRSLAPFAWFSRWFA